MHLRFAGHGSRWSPSPIIAPVRSTPRRFERERDDSRLSSRPAGNALKPVYDAWLTRHIYTVRTNTPDSNVGQTQRFRTGCRLSAELVEAMTVWRSLPIRSLPIHVYSWLLHETVVSSASDCPNTRPAWIRDVAPGYPGQSRKPQTFRALRNIGNAYGA